MSCLRFLLALALLSYSSVSLSADWREFTLESAPGFTVQVLAEGKVKINEDCICIDIQNAKLFRPDGVENTEKIIGIMVGIASLIDPPSSEGDTWEEFAISMSPVLLPVLLKPDGELELAPFTRVIELEDKVVPEDIWVMMSVVAGEPDDYGVSYAHEPGTPTR